MSIKNMPWFRMYIEAVDDEKLRLLAFEDRWHFVALLCCKGQGILEEDGPLLMRKVAVKLGIDVRTLEEVARRLAEVGLVDAKTLQPIGWEDRQMQSDSSAGRTRAYRERMKQEPNVTVTSQERSGDGDVTAQDTDTDTDKEEDKNKGEKTTRTRKRAADSSSTAGESDDAKPLNATALVAEGVDRKHARDWLTLRKAKRLPLTPTAWDSVKEEAAACGMTPAQAVKHAVESNWAGFKAKWIAAGSAGAHASAAPNKQEALEARNREVAARVAAKFQAQQGAAQ
jgi:hypothetical protein